MRRDIGNSATRLRAGIPPALLDLRLQLTGLRFELALRRLVRFRRPSFDPNQPRRPAGRPDGGQWTDGNGLDDETGADGEILFVGGRSSGGRGRTARRYPGATAAQELRLAASENALRAALTRVKEVDPRWKPQPQLTASIDGQISANIIMARQAELRFLELQTAGIGPGSFAGGSTPARGPGKRFTAQERLEINRIGRDKGCHTCGTKEPGTTSGNFVPDHQLPTARNPSGTAQRLFPHCLTCSLSQGGWVRNNGGY